MKLAIQAFFVVVSFGSVFAQTTADEIGSDKKILKKELIKYAPYVYDVDFSGCDATIKISSGSRGSFSFGPSSVVGGTFPRDDGSGSFSAGPGNEIRPSGSSNRYVIRLSDLSVDDVTVYPPFRRKLSTIKITGNTGGAVGMLKKGVVTTRPEFAVAVKQKAADKTADTFRSLISRCKGHI